MAKLYYRYGAMSSSKTANAIMVKYNYGEQGQHALLVKPAVDLEAIKNHAYDCVIVDEAQFLTRDEVYLLTELVDEYNVPVICYGLRADFQGNLFEGSKWLLAWADTIEEVKTICWCGRKATFNARLDGCGGITKVGEQVVLGAGDKYVGLCRRHWKLGDPGPGRRKGE